MHKCNCNACVHVRMDKTGMYCIITSKYTTPADSCYFAEPNMLTKVILSEELHGLSNR